MPNTLELEYIKRSTNKIHDQIADAVFIHLLFEIQHNRADRVIKLWTTYNHPSTQALLNRMECEFLHECPEDQVLYTMARQYADGIRADLSIAHTYLDTFADLYEAEAKKLDLNLFVLDMRKAKIEAEKVYGSGMILPTGEQQIVSDGAVGIYTCIYYYLNNEEICQDRDYYALICVALNVACAQVIKNIYTARERMDQFSKTLFDPAYFEEDLSADNELHFITDTDLWKKYYQKRKKEFYEIFSEEELKHLRPVKNSSNMESLFILAFGFQYFPYDKFLDFYQQELDDAEDMDEIITDFIYMLFIRDLSNITKDHNATNNNDKESLLSVLRYRKLVDHKEQTILEFREFYNESILLNYIRYAFTIAGYEKYFGEQSVDVNTYDRLNKDIENKDTLIRSLKKQLEQSPKNVPTIVSDDTQVVELQKQLRRLQSENEKLKEQNHEYQEYISLLDSLDENNDQTESDNVDMAYLQSKRFLFVGGIEMENAKLKRLFPNALFAQTENFDMTNIKVDAIVYFTKYMNHCQWYKIRNGNTKQIQEIFFNYKNTDRLYRYMEDELKRAEEKQAS